MAFKKNKNAETSEVSESQAEFVDAYTKTLSPRKAERMTGLPNVNADRIHKRRSRMLTVPIEKVMKKIEYNIEKMFEETDYAMELADSTGNANAYVKAIELRAKVFKLIDNKDPVHAAQFFVHIQGLNDSPPNIQVAQVTPVQQIAVTPLLPPVIEVESKDAGDEMVVAQTVKEAVDSRTRKKRKWLPPTFNKPKRGRPKGSKNIKKSETPEASQSELSEEDILGDFLDE